MFLNIVINCKGGNDFRAFLYFADFEEKKEYEIRGYGTTPGEAATYAWEQYNSDDRELHIIGARDIEDVEE